MGSIGGGFLSLVVANGAIYNRIVIPGKTQLLTPHWGARQDRGNLAQAPLSFPAGEGANGEEGKEGVCQSTALSPGWECLLEGPADPCAAPGRRPFPCPAWLCFPPLGSVSWLRMPELLRTVLRQDSGDGRGRDGPAGGFAQTDSASSLVGLPGRALQSQPCPAPASPSSHSPTACVFPKRF